MRHPVELFSNCAIFQAILKGLVMWIVGTSASAQRVRANLYGALLNYLRIGKVNAGQMGKNSHEEKLKKANLEVLLGYGDAFLDIVCRDSVSGHEIRMMLALSLLDELICLEGMIFFFFLTPVPSKKVLFQKIYTEYSTYCSYYPFK